MRRLPTQIILVVIAYFEGNGEQPASWRPGEQPTAHTLLWSLNPSPTRAYDAGKTQFVMIIMKFWNRCVGKVEHALPLCVDAKMIVSHRNLLPIFCKIEILRYLSMLFLISNNKAQENCTSLQKLITETYLFALLRFFQKHWLGRISEFKMRISTSDI